MTSVRNLQNTGICRNLWSNQQQAFYVHRQLLAHCEHASVFVDISLDIGHFWFSRPKYFQDNWFILLLLLLRTSTTDHFYCPMRTWTRFQRLDAMAVDMLVSVKAAPRTMIFVGPVVRRRYNSRVPSRILNCRNGCTFTILRTGIWFYAFV